MMRRAHASKDKFGAAFGGLKNAIAGAFTVGAIASLSRQTIDFASHLNDVSTALQVNVEWFQKRANAARLAGGSEDDLFKFIDSMTKNRSAAVQDPKGEEAKSFGRLGFSGGEISGLSTMAFFDKIVKAFGSGATAQTSVDAEKVGGKSARNLLAAFYEGFKSDAKFMSQEMIDSLDDIGDRFTILKNLLMVELAPAIVFAGNAIMAFVNKTRQLGSELGAQTAETSEARQNRYDTSKKQYQYSKKLLATRADLTPEDTQKLKSLMKTSLAIMRGELRGPGALAADEEEQRQLKDARELAAAQDAARAERKNREKGPPGFDRLPVKEDKPGRHDIPTDALVGIGNFLGRNGSLVNSVADQTLQVSRLHLAATIAMKQELIRLALKLAPGTGGTLGIPGA
ncbi:MAG: hypothetical protein PHQ12_15060 [Chthoniobacteraceae bacterium]|nr:hypothetical protein [Chthoniobacteraceae bacterium]